MVKPMRRSAVCYIRVSTQDQTEGCSLDNPVLYSHMDSAMRRVLKATGINKKSPIHSFRPTNAMMMISHGIPVHIVANQLGDSVETVVRTYIQPEMPEQALVDGVFAGVSCVRTNRIKWMILAIPPIPHPTPREQRYPHNKKAFSAKPIGR